MEKRQGTGLTRQARIAIYEYTKIGFLWEAVAEGADKQVPIGMTQAQWERQKDIGKAYSYCRYVQKELREIFGKRNIGKSHRDFLRNLHGNSSPELKKRVSLQDLLVKKPLARVSDELPRTEIDLPKSDSLLQDIDKAIEEEEDDRKIQKILDGLSTKSIRYYLGRNSKERKTLTTLTKILIRAGLHIESKDLVFIVDTLKDKGIPIRRVEVSEIKKGDKKRAKAYIIVPVKREGKILEVLKQNPDIFEKFRDNPVQQLYGSESEKLPNTSQLLKGEKYASVGSMLLRYFGLRFRGTSHIRHSDLLDGCPVSIFTIGHRKWYFYPVEKEEDLRAFIEEKMKKLGILRPA